MKKLLIISFLFIVSLSLYSQPNFEVITKSTEEVAQKYFKHYFDLEFDQLELLMHDSISFQDPTAEFVFSGELIKGKAPLMEFFKTNYASIIGMNTQINRSIISSGVALFEIDLTWSFEGNTPDEKVTIKKMPLVIILKIKDGKVIEHRDYGDYRVFMEQYRSQVIKD
jgi:limonene-1,2-epoxide hydrolase